MLTVNDQTSFGWLVSFLFNKLSGLLGIFAATVMGTVTAEVITEVEVITVELAVVDLVKVLIGKGWDGFVGRFLRHGSTTTT